MAEIAKDRGYKDGWIVHQINLRRGHNRKRWGGDAADAFIAEYRARAGQTTQEAA